MIVAAAITNRVTKTVSGIDRDYQPVCRDLSEGWTLMARDELAERPERLQLIGRRYTYIALLEDGQLLLIGARERRAWDGTDEDVLQSPRYYEPIVQSHDQLPAAALRALSERWNDAHQRRAARRNARIERWLALNEIRAFVAHEHGAIVALAEQAWDPDRLAEGQLGGVGGP
jgi:hypothetical protein